MSEIKCILENERILAAFLPYDGGRLVSLIDKQCGRDYIWTNRRTEKLSRYYGADYDSLSAGGVEEAFPCVLPEIHNGNHYPFFGELWAISWDVDSKTENMLTLSAYSSLMPARVRKIWELSGDNLLCRYELENLGYSSLSCLLGVHPSFAVQEGDILSLPQGNYFPGVFITDKTVPPEFSWPMAGEINLSRILSDASSGECYQFSSCDMADGFIKITGENNFGIELTYDHAFFPSLSVWEIYGGWRGHYVLMTEFFAGWPLKISDAVAQKNCVTIYSKESIVSEVKYAFF